MSVVDLVLKNCRIITAGDMFEGGLAVDSGEIVAVAKDWRLPPADRVVDLHGNLVIPGAIDAHCHCHAMGRSDWEDFKSGTMAAAAGGVTTVLEMPQTLPPTSTVEAFVEKRRTAGRDVVVNFGLYGGAGSQNITEIPRMAAEGAIAFKTFMPPPSPGREKDMWGLYVTDDGSFLETLKTIARTGLLSCVHAENWQIHQFLAQKLESEGRKDLSAYLESRPGITESEGISRATMLAAAAGARAHICHVAAREAVEVISRAKQAGQTLTAETCPHYLTFTAEQVNHLGAYAKINPPIRTPEDRDMLWKGLGNGAIDVVASDHGPFAKEWKEAGLQNIWKASMGTPTLDVMLPVMLTHVRHGLISLESLVRVMSENVARIFGLYPKKGNVQVGADADLVVVDLKRKKKLRAEEFYTKAKDIALVYDGVNVEGLPVATYVNGVEVMSNGEVSGKPGTGRFVKPCVNGQGRKSSGSEQR
jgi:allantoinase